MGRIALLLLSGFLIADEGAQPHLISRLTRDRRFVRHGQGLYGLRDGQG